MKKDKCPRCGFFGGRTIETLVNSPYAFYIKDFCQKCGYFHLALVPTSGNDRRELSGSWSRSNQQDREGHAKDILQPMKKDGTINKHFVQAHGTKALEKELKVDKKTIMDNVAKYG